MKFGYFDSVNKEYVITRPDTPTPWINYIGEGRYGGIISNTAGGYSFDRDPRNRRILRYRYNGVPMDRPGRYLYVRDEETGLYWSPTWQPVLTDLELYECRHGLGYTTILGKLNGISSKITYFVSLNEDLELWIMRIKNETNLNKKLRIFSYAEFCFFNAVQDQQNVDWIQQIGQANFKDGIIYFSTFARTEGIIYFSSNGEISSYDCSLETFLGRYRSEANPIAVEKGECSNSTAHRGNGVGALCNKIALLPNEEKEIIFILGVASTEKEIGPKVKVYNDSKMAWEAFGALKNYWETAVSNFSVETPEKDMNLFLNIWNQYQCKTTFNWSRFVSMYQLGINRGMGFRDSSQDLLGIMHNFSSKAKERLVDLLKNQFADGDAYHKYSPLTGLGEERGYSDDHLWIVISVAEYLKETGDFEFLNQIVPYVGNEEKGTVYEHLQKAINFSQINAGPHGLPKMGFADWNDTLNFTGGKGIAESIFVAFLLGKALQEMSKLANIIGRTEDEKRYLNDYEKLKLAVNRVAWDGEWYIRAFDDFGKKVGSKENEKGKIFLETQPWSIISGFADTDRGIKCLDSVKKYLDTEYGLMLMWPPYNRFDPNVGGVTTYPPGAKENGGIFLHANTWAIVAEAILGRGERTFEYYKKILPTTKNDIAEVHEVEPYVYCQNILSKEHPLFGLGRNSWLTGTASWAYVAATNYILGIKADYNGLIVDPCIPKGWKEFSVKRIFRGKRFNITIKNPHSINKGVRFIELNGEKIIGNTIPIQEAKDKNEVMATMGV